MDVIQYEYVAEAINQTFMINRTNLTYSNSTEFTLPNAAHKPWLTALLTIMATFVSLCTTVGNIMVVISFIMEKRIRVPANYLIASLAVTDIIIGASSMPLYTLYILKSYWPLDDLTCDFWLSLDYTVCLVSQYTVFLITLDRFCSVKVPTKYRNWRTPRKMKVMVAVTWIVPALIFFTSIMGWHHFNAGLRSRYVCMAMFQEDPMFSAILVICYYWITLIIMIGLYAGIYQVALNLQRRSRETKKRIERQSQKTKPESSAKETERLLLSSSDMTPGLTPSTQTSTESNGASSKKNPDKTMTTAADSVASLLKPNLCQETSSPKLQTHLQPPSIKVDKCLLAPPQTLPINNNNNVSHANGQLDAPAYTTQVESPIWKPRNSLPNCSIHWDAFTGQTFVKMEKEDNRDSNNESAKDISESATPSPKLPQKRHSKRRKRSQTQSRSDYNDSSSETSECDNKPKVLGHISSLVTSINPQRKSRKRKKVSPNRSVNRARKALRTISFILGAFVVCWTPYHVIVLVDSFCESCKIHPRVYEISYWLCYMNSPLNPFCYALSNPQFKKSFLNIVKLTYLRNCLQKLRQR